MAASAMWSWSCVSIFFLFLCFTGVLSISDDVRRDFIIKEVGKDSSASKLFVSHAPNSVSFLPNAGEIPSNEISSIISLALGFSIPKDISWAGLMAGDMFRRPKANILISVDGVMKDDKFDIPCRVSFPVKEMDDAAGVAGVLAISNAEQENLPTRIAKIFDGKPLTLSISGDETLAGLGSGFGVNSHTFYWRQTEDKFLLTDDETAGIFEDLQFSKDHFLSKFEKSRFGNGIKYSKDANLFTVAVPGKGNAVFNMNKKEDFMLFAEVQMMLDTLDKLRTNPRIISDGVPDVLTLTISSLKMIRGRYGKDSLQAQGAVQFLASVIPKLTQGFADLYRGNALVEVLTTEYHGDLKEKFPNEIHGIFQHLEPHLASQDMESFQQQLPNVNLRHDMDDVVKQSLCDSLHNKLLAVQSKLQVSCLGRKRRAVEALTAAPSPSPKYSKNPLNLAYNYTPFYSTIFNIWLWLVIILALSVYVISLVLWYMDPGRDSIIYRMTSQRMKTE